MTWGVLSAVTGLGNHEHMADDDHQAKVDAEFRQLLDDLDKLAAKWSRLSEHVLERAAPDVRDWFERSRQRRSNLH
jgi:ElaB/YqjD/DUF883 family membrane-anchored ribosome-binding protein